jgi:hypothetical protein
MFAKYDHYRSGSVVSSSTCVRSWISHVTCSTAIISTNIKAKAKQDQNNENVNASTFTSVACRGLILLQLKNFACHASSSDDLMKEIESQIQVDIGKAG